MTSYCCSEHGEFYMLLLLYGPKAQFQIGCEENLCSCSCRVSFECAPVRHLRSLADRKGYGRSAKDAVFT